MSFIGQDIGLYQFSWPIGSSGRLASTVRAIAVRAAQSLRLPPSLPVGDYGIRLAIYQKCIAHLNEPVASSDDSLLIDRVAAKIGSRSRYSQQAFERKIESRLTP